MLEIMGRSTPLVWGAMLWFAGSGCGAEEVDPAGTDGQASCGGVLPANPCPVGLMALPGEQSCREVAPCGEGTWGDIPTDSNTEFVDGAYVGADSDGSMERPWTTIGDGLTAATAGATVAIAAGRYPSAVEIDKQVKLRGRCPSLVEISPSSGGTAIWVRAGGSGSQVHDVALSGGGLSAAEDTSVVIERLWLHDANAGVTVWGSNGGAHLQMRGSLIERVGTHGISAYDASVTVEDTVIRDIEPSPAGIPLLLLSPHLPAIISIRRCLVERGAGVGALLQGNSTEITDTVLRDMTPSSNQLYGDGIVLLGFDADLNGSVDGDLRLADSFICGNERAGLANFGGSVTIDRVHFDCNGLDINGEPDAYGLGHPPHFDDLGGNRCGCGTEQIDCQILSTGLEPPGG